MNSFEKLLYLLQQGTMQTPTTFGWFHCMCLILTFITIIILIKYRNKMNEKHLKLVLGIYSTISLLLEILKQLIWSFNYDPSTNIITWDYTWYAFPFQLCTTPIYVCLICLFLKKVKLRDKLLSYISYVTILGSIATIIMPQSCFVEDILVNIHTMWLHLGSFVVSIYLLITKEVEINLTSLKNAITIFLVFVVLALLLNISIYNSNILNGETFNMFYISPYFISSLPVFDIIQPHVPYPVYLIIYIWAIIIGALIIYSISILIKIISHKLNNKEKRGNV